MEIVESVVDSWVLDNQRFGVSLLDSLIRVSEQVGMVGFLDRKDEVVTMVLENSHLAQINLSH
jgi:hypothetical protein